MSAPPQNESAGPGPAVNLVDHGFMDSRAKLIDIAAFLDRLDRHGQTEDYRVAALVNAIGELTTGEHPDRARRVLEAFSDPSDAPIEVATVQGAAGAFDPSTADTGGEQA